MTQHVLVLGAGFSGLELATRLSETLQDAVRVTLLDRNGSFVFGFCTGPRIVPKAGIFAEAAARVVADDIAATIVGGEPPAPYGGSGVCYAEFGDGLVSKVEVDLLGGPAAAAQRHDPSREHAAEKEEFGATRRARWFGL